MAKQPKRALKGKRASRSRKMVRRLSDGVKSARSANSKKRNAPTRLFEKDSLDILRSALDELEKGFADLPSSVVPVKNKRSFERVIGEVTERMKNNYPYFHPLYAGQMLKPPHPIARVAYMLSMWITPDTHALAGGRARS